MEKKASPNFDERAEGQAPDMVILHYTGMETALAALARLCDPAAKVSAHYFIDEDGGAVQLVEDEKRAWHAGISHWRGRSDINSRSIGIELVNPGHEFGYRPFPAAQIEALSTLCKHLMRRHKILPGNVLGHSDVAPARKVDPGTLFPWEALADQGIGLWPVPEQMDIEAGRELVESGAAIALLLAEYGYDPEARPESVVAAFHRHFYPEKFKAGNNPLDPDEVSFARLLSLMRMNSAEKV